MDQAVEPLVSRLSEPNHVPGSKKVSPKGHFHGLEFIGIVAHNVGDKAHGNVCGKDAIESSGHDCVSWQDELRTRHVHHESRPHAAFDGHESSSLPVSAQPNAPLGFGVCEGQHQTLVGSGVHDETSCMPHGKYACTRRRTISPATVEDHPRRPSPSWASQHTSTAGLPGF